MNDIELIKSKINIVDLVGEYLPLKKTGINYKASCPFHSEKTPSFFVSPERQIFRCFGCGKGGDIFKFLMEKEGLEFKDSLEILAKKAGITLQRKAAFKKDPKDRLYEINLKAKEFYHYILTKHPLGKKALEYLQGRGIIDSFLEEFGIGYAPNSWDSLTKFLLKKGFTVAELVTSGLAVSSRSGCYDRFRGRIIFPLIDYRDRVVGFSGRVLYQVEPKYINTPQTPIFDKSNFLFGLNLAKGEIRVKNEAILVEGEMDVILSFQSGAKNVVASKGTGLTSGQIETLKKYTQNLMLCFDMDLAGDIASRRGIEMADKAGVNIKVIQIPDGKDAAELVLKNPEGWHEAIEEAVPIYDYYLQSVSQRFNPKDPVGVKKIVAELIPVWAKISDDLVREMYIQKLAAFLKVEETMVRKAVNKERANQSTYAPMALPVVKDDQVLNTKSYRELLEEYLLALLLHIPLEVDFVPNTTTILSLFVSEHWKQIYVMLILYLDSISFKGRQFNINEFVRSLPAELTEDIDRLYLVELDEKLTNKEAWQKELDRIVAQLKKALIKASLEKLSLEIKNAQAFGKMEVLESLNRRFRDLSVKLKNL